MAVSNIQSVELAEVARTGAHRWPVGINYEQDLSDAITRAVDNVFAPLAASPLSIDRHDVHIAVLSGGTIELTYKSRRDGMTQRGGDG